MKGIFLLFIIAILSLSCAVKKYDSSITVTGLRCDYFENPLGIDNRNPKLSWIIKSTEKNQKQTAYQILVASSLKHLNNEKGDIWDTGKIKSDQSCQIIYQGKPLQSTKKYYWKVRVWDKNNNRSEWSITANWEMGLLKPEQWKAQWIGFNSQTAPLFRKEIEISKTLKEARVYISGLGFYELSINGNKIGDHVLDPGQTDYEQRTFYVVYDVTQQLKQGTNAIGIMLGNGWYNQNVVNSARYGWGDAVYGKPRLLFQMQLTFDDGTEKTVISDETWKVSPGPVTSNNLYAGEQYDARLEQPGWNNSGFNDNDWNKVSLVEAPGGKLVCQNIPPIKKMDTIAPVNITNPKPGIYIYDMGQNFAGWAKLTVNAEKGTKIQLRFAENLDKNGLLNPASTGVYATGVVQTDGYTCKGNGTEIWELRFTYHGFRYVEMAGFPGTPSKDNLKGIVVHSSLQEAGEFTCSDERLNRLHKTALWTEKSNLHSIPTDCPHRERCGWLGDAFLTSDMTIYNFDAATFWSKFLVDIETSRRDGIPDNIVPGRRSGGKSPDWGAAYIQLTWNMFLYYGDKSVISEHYDGMTFFMNHLQQIASNNIVHNGIGSLFSPNRITPEETPKAFTSTMLYYFCADVISRMSKAIEKKSEAEKFALLATQIKNSFNSKFYNKEKKTYEGQEKNVLALAFNLVPQEDKQAVANNLNKDIIENHNYHVSTGIFGSRYIYEILAQFGFEETVKKILHSNTFPSYGYLFSRGATTFWENWGELKFEDRLKIDGDERSKNHPFQGGFDAWFYNGIVGIKPDPENPGFKHIIFRPQLTNVLDSAKATYNSIHGPISSNWQNAGNEFKWFVSVPANTTATIFIPANKQDSIFKNGKPIKELKQLQNETRFRFHELESGEYSFKVKRNSYPEK
ncbi:family 78 glycoside hydrolase catalytic domain [Maribellus maritimus]|uniref:family 78 glycoside hydrolase catalytic domain n=1 Tax=Maribellus maritimus TaxID=2870838 RepID=UPI001EEA8EE0|nr:family 78 glycoside hydrolase catalytic domain [Maribellus maritimus]MCG6189757.1 glycoside hydrolase family 78 protein [Maribellus maritimus]